MDGVRARAAAARARVCTAQLAARNETYDRVVAGLWARPSLEDFDLGARLGRGANAAVVRATHASGTAVAVKIPYPLAREATTQQLLRYQNDFELLSPVSRLHAATGGEESDGWSFHILTFVTTLTVRADAALIARLGLDAALLADMGVMGQSSLAIVGPLLGPSLQEVVDGRRRSGGGGGGGGGGGARPVLAPRAWTLLALQLAKALARCNVAWVVHRDVKLENVLLRRGLWSTTPGGACPGGTGWCGDDDTLCVLADFGTSLNCLRGGGEGRFAREAPWDGTPAYMAPECSRAIARRAAVIEYGGQDAWGLGMALWRMLCPLRGDYPPATPFPGFDVPHRFPDARYAPPGDVAGGGGGDDDAAAAAAAAPELYRRAAGRIVRQLLRVDPASRCTLAAAVARLEVLLFVLLPLPVPPPPLPALLERLDDTVGALHAAALRVDPARPSVAEMLLVDFAGSLRCSPEAIGGVMRDLLA